MSSGYPLGRDFKLPPRLKTPEDHSHTSPRPASHEERIFFELLNDYQKPEPSKQPRIPLAPRSKTTVSSKSSIIQSTRRSLSAGLDRSKTALANTAVAAASKKTAGKVATRLSEMIKKKDKKKGGETAAADLSRISSTSSSTKSLYHRHKLPKLQIPDTRVAVDEALHRTCSTETQKSASYGVLGMSPTSREIWLRLGDEHYHNDHHQNHAHHHHNHHHQKQSATANADAEADFHNMFSARRRVRKSSFGAAVARYRRARPTWDESWASRAGNDNLEDRELLRRLTDALQDQKDHATRLVQENSSFYPGLRPVTAPGSTLKLHWQGHSSYR